MSQPRAADDSPLADPVAGDVGALSVDVDEAVADELASLRTGTGLTRTVDDVVETLLEQPRQFSPSGLRANRLS